MDLIELDAASNRGIDEIRSLREKVGFAPATAEFKVYIIDEAHMLTDAAFNALLKTLEEPPPHVIFVLATTEPHKVPATIASRCQRFDFRRIPLDASVERLDYICRQEGISCPREALELIARTATGSLRDGVNLLEQVMDYHGRELTLEAVRSGLGLTGDARSADLGPARAQGRSGRGPGPHRRRARRRARPASVSARGGLLSASVAACPGGSGERPQPDQGAGQGDEEAAGGGGKRSPRAGSARLRAGRPSRRPLVVAAAGAGAGGVHTGQGCGAAAAPVAGPAAAGARRREAGEPPAAAPALSREDAAPPRPAPVAPGRRRRRCRRNLLLPLLRRRKRALPRPPRRAGRLLAGRRRKSPSEKASPPRLGRRRRR